MAIHIDYDREENKIESILDSQGNVISTLKPFYGSVKSIRNRSEKFGLYGSNFILEKPVSQIVR